VPPYRSNYDLGGRVRGVSPDSHEVAVYIFIEGGGWWNKPYFAQPLTPIQPDSTWTCDITTGSGDEYASEIRAYLMPNGMSPPLSSGWESLPGWLDTLPHADTVRERPAVHFAGYDWWLKASSGPVGPGPNYFSDSSANVWVDVDGRLHLRITHSGGRWLCPELVCRSRFGYGPYAFSTASRVGDLDQNVILGFFTWDNAAAEHHREIDIEFSRWGVAGDSNAQYVIQPWDTPGNRYRWMLAPDVDSSSHRFDWQPDSIRFTSTWDSGGNSWVYTGPGVPTPGNEYPRLNLWLLNGSPPSDSDEVEVVVTRFETGITDLPGNSRGQVRHGLRSIAPNPFRSETVVRFTVSAPSDVRLGIANALGQEVAALVDCRLAPGDYFVSWDGTACPAGVYFCRLETGGSVQTRQLVLLK
jgi:hypothetical protein